MTRRTAKTFERARLWLARRHVLDHAWVLSLAVAARAPGSFQLAIDQLAFAVPCGGSGVSA